MNYLCLLILVSLSFLGGIGMSATKHWSLARFLTLLLFCSTIGFTVFLYGGTIFGVAVSGVGMIAILLFLGLGVIAGILVGHYSNFKTNS